MTIALTSVSGVNKIGIGVQMQIASSFGPGSTPAGSNWWITPFNVESSTQFGWRFVTPAPNFGPTEFNFGLTGTGGENIVFDTAGLSDGQSVGVQLSLVSPTAHIDDTTITSPFVWQGDGSTQRFLMDQPAGGLTSTQATQLANADIQSAAAEAGLQVTMQTPSGPITGTLGQLFGGGFLDALTLTELTSGPTCARFVAGMAGSPFGLIVRCTTIPDFYPFTAPGDTWTPLDLLVVTFIRGSDTLSRVGIHTGTHMFYPLPGNIWPGGTQLEIDLLPPDYAVQIDPGNGVCFRAYGMNLP